MARCHWIFQDPQAFDQLLWWGNRWVPSMWHATSCYQLAQGESDLRSENDLYSRCPERWHDCLITSSCPYDVSQFVAIWNEVVGQSDHHVRLWKYQICSHGIAPGWTDAKMWPWTPGNDLTKKRLLLDSGSAHTLECFSRYLCICLLPESPW